jgi:enoyl-CoA hydratase
LTEVTLDVMPGAGGKQNLARAIGERRAKELILSGVPFSPSEAETWGLVNRVLPPEHLMVATLAVVSIACSIIAFTWPRSVTSQPMASTS